MNLTQKWKGTMCCSKFKFWLGSLPLMCTSAYRTTYHSVVHQAVDGQWWVQTSRVASEPSSHVFYTGIKLDDVCTPPRGLHRFRFHLAIMWLDSKFSTDHFDIMNFHWHEMLQVRVPADTYRYQDSSRIFSKCLKSYITWLCKYVAKAVVHRYSE